VIDTYKETFDTDQMLLTLCTFRDLCTTHDGCTCTYHKTHANRLLRRVLARPEPDTITHFSHLNCTKGPEMARKSAKFLRDIDSDWTVKNDKPSFGVKDFPFVEVKSDLVLSTLFSRTSEHDTNYF
jgi:hypothetical protein